MLDLSLSLGGRGWAESILINDTDKVHISASYLSDGIKDLVVAVTLLLDGNPSSECRWQDEPGENRWFFSVDGDMVTLNVSKMNKTFSNQDSNKGKIIFSGCEDILKISRLVSREMEMLISEFGEAGYYETKKLWLCVRQLKAIAQ